MEMINQKPQEIMRLPYERVLIPEEEGGFSAYIGEFEGCMAEGETPEETMKNLESTAISWIEAERDAGRDIPLPWNLQEFSGKLLLRLPKSLHRQLARLANKEGTSLNQYVVNRLAAAACEDEVRRMLSEVLEKTRSVYIAQHVSFASTNPEHLLNVHLRATHKGAATQLLTW